MRTIIRDNYTPEIGDYHEKIIRDEAQGKMWIFDCDGVFTEMGGGVEVVNELGHSTTAATSQDLVTTELDKKQNTLTFDSTPTAGSTNPVTSEGIKNYVDSNTVTFSPFPASVDTTHSTQDFMNSILALHPATGAAFLGTVSLTDMPTGLIQEEVEVYVYSDYVIYCIMRSTDAAPYAWWCASYNYQGWKPTDTTYTAGSNVSINDGVISATDTTYTAGSGLTLTDTEFSADTTVLATQNDLLGKQNTLTAGSNISISEDTISATDTTYAAGAGLSLSGTEFSVDTSAIQPKLTAGANITINGDEISATDTTYTAGTNVQINGTTISATDTTYSDFVGATSGAAGSAGLVPAPAQGDTDKYLKSDGSWATVSQYTLPVASANTLGGVKIGSNLSMDANDVLSATDTTYTNFIGTDGTAAGTAGLVPAPATTDAGKVLGADGNWTGLPDGIKTLTTADYNLPAGSPNCIDGAALDPGFYLIGEQVYIRRGSGNNVYSAGDIFIKASPASSTTTDLYPLFRCAGTTKYWTYAAKNENNNQIDSGTGPILKLRDIANSLTDTSSEKALSAAKGKVLNERIGDLTALTTTAKTSAVAAINELDSAVANMPISEITDTDPGADTTTTANTITFVYS